MSEATKIMLYDAAKKSVGVAYLLWFFFGFFGAHRIYVGKNSGYLMLGAVILGLILASQGASAGAWLCIAVGVWALVDVFFVPGLVRERNVDLARQLDGAGS